MSGESEYTQNQLNYLRSKGVARAWERERGLVQQGRGTRQWTVKEQKELLKTGRVKGYHGHHMKSVAKHPKDADNPKNIQFLSSRKSNNEHLRAHKGDFKNESNGRYNPRTDTIRPLKGDKVRAVNSYELKDKAIEKRGYTKYATNKSAKGQRARTGERAGSQKGRATQYNGVTYSRAAAKTGRPSRTDTQNPSSSRSSSDQSKSELPRYGEKTSQLASRPGGSGKGSYGHKAGGAGQSSGKGNYGHTSATGGPSHGASHGTATGGQSRGGSSGGASHGNSSGGQSHGGSSGGSSQGGSSGGQSHGGHSR